MSGEDAQFDRLEGENPVKIREYAQQIMRDTIEIIKFETHIREDFQDSTQQRAFCLGHAVAVVNSQYTLREAEGDIADKVTAVADKLLAWLVPSKEVPSDPKAVHPVAVE